MSRPYFIADRVVPSGDAVYVIGRTGDMAIPLGHKFSNIYLDVAAWRERAASTQCSLAVTEIFAYGHRLEEADPGLTARIQVQGSGIEALHEAKIIE